MKELNIEYGKCKKCGREYFPPKLPPEMYPKLRIVICGDCGEKINVVDYVYENDD